MKVKKFSKEWFENKLLQAEKMIGGRGKRLTSTKGYKPNIRYQNNKFQRINDIKKLAKDKGIKI